MGACTSRTVPESTSTARNRFRFNERKLERDDDHFRPEQAPTATSVKKETGDDIFSRVLRRRRNDSAADLGASISNTFKELTREDPAAMEENAIRRAMELSMLDCALTIPFQRYSSDSKGKTPQPHDILGVEKTASLEEIKSAYRKLALETHPDKGGSPDKFAAVARAYRTLLGRNQEETSDGTRTTTTAIKTTAHWDSELREHRGLVDELFLNHGADISTNVARQSSVLASLGLAAKEAGASNRNEKNQRIRNSCFYLSLATSYLNGIGAYGHDDLVCKDKAVLDADKQLTGETALLLKRSIEAAVVSAHPEWATQGMVGEEVQAFSDFLVYVLDSPSHLSDLAVAIFDTSSGFVDVYKGKNFSTDNVEVARSNTLTLRYVPGHYQPLIPSTTKLRPTLDELLSSLDKAEVFYVVTDGAD